MGPPGTVLSLFLFLVACGASPAGEATRVMVQDFEKASSLPAVWVVNIPNENASVRLSADRPHEGFSFCANQLRRSRSRLVGTGEGSARVRSSPCSTLHPLHSRNAW